MTNEDLNKIEEALRLAANALTPSRNDEENEALRAVIAALHIQALYESGYDVEEIQPQQWKKEYTRVDAGTGREKPLEDTDWPNNGGETCK